jgi:hypothetical protein
LPHPSGVHVTRCFSAPGVPQSMSGAWAPENPTCHQRSHYHAPPGGTASRQRGCWGMLLRGQRHKAVCISYPSAQAHSFLPSYTLQHADMLSAMEQTLTLGCKASGASGVYLPDMSQLSTSWFSHRQTLRLCALWLDERRGFQRYEEHQNIGAASNTTS